MKENNQYLAEGAECKELLHSKNIELRIVDSTLAVKSKIEDRLTRESQALEASNNELVGTVFDQGQKLAQAKEAIESQALDLQKQKRRKVIWRNIAIPEGLFIVACIVGAILLL